MKKLTLILTILMFLSISSMAKDAHVTEMSNLKIALNSYKDATFKMNVEEIMTYIYPGLYKLFPKDSMEQSLKTMYSSGQAPKIVKMDIQKIGPIKTFDDGFFATVFYDMSMQMSIGEFNPELKDKMIASLKLKLGEKSKIVFDEKTNTFIIDKESKMIAIKEGSTGWKFLEEEKASLLKDKIFPKSLLEKLK